METSFEKLVAKNNQVDKYSLSNNNRFPADAPNRTQRTQIQVPYLLEVGQGRRALEDRRHCRLETQGTRHPEPADVSEVQDQGGSSQREGRG